jgi:very-short-patch-repair endonuclease
VPGTKPLTGVARRLRQDSTDAEKLLWRALREEPFKGAHFRRQVPLGAYVADFVGHSARLVIELDGGQHAEAEQAAKDDIRSAALAERRYRVLRFWNNDVLSNIDGVLATIADALTEGGRAAPTPDPSPQGGGE